MGVYNQANFWQPSETWSTGTTGEEGNPKNPVWLQRDFWRILVQMCKSLKFEGVTQTRMSVHLAKCRTSKDDRNVKLLWSKKYKRRDWPIAWRKWQRKGRITHLHFVHFVHFFPSHLPTASAEVLTASEDDPHLPSPEVSNPSYNSSPITCRLNCRITVNKPREIEIRKKK